MAETIQPGNSVWFHNHPEGDPCDANCYEQKATTSTVPRMRYFIRVDGVLYEVDLITRRTEVQPYVLVSVRGKRVMHVHVHDLIISY